MALSEPRRRAYLQAMGITAWERRAASGVAPATVTLEPPAAPPLEVPPAIARGEAPLLDWESLQAQVATCTACKLHERRTQTVFGVGNRRARWLVVGEAPGAEEDRQGEPFVGRAGKLLNNMLLAIGLKREEVYIANIIKCRPPGNRDPEPDEVASCEGYLQRQIQLLQPQIILAVGRVAMQNLLKTDRPIGTMRGRKHSYAGIPTVVTYHPAYLLRSPLEKRKAWQDLKFAVSVYRESSQAQAQQ